MGSQQQTSYTPAEMRDEWETPQYLYDYIQHRFGIDVDLACTKENQKATRGITSPEYNSLSERWLDHGKRGFFNPPYSCPSAWMQKAHEESQEGFLSVGLVPLNNGENYHGNWVLGKAASITQIIGRIAFISPCDYIIPGKNGSADRLIKKGDAVPGNTKGSCLVEYSPFHSGTTSLDWVWRDRLKAGIYDSRKM